MSATATSLSKYRTIVEIARGGMGDVFLAVSRGPGGFHKLVVIKELRATLSTDQEFLAMFMNEAKLSARLHHPNIVQTNEVGQEGNRYFMAMEYLEGQTLNRCVQKIPRGDLTADMQLRVLVDVLNGLHYAHELADYDGAPLGIVHRDISPHNVLITYGGQAKILDFGIAKTRDSAQQTATGVLKGKVPYMAPEQLDRNQDRRCDVFAVGVMVWEAVAGRRMWAEKTDLGIVQALADARIPSIRDVKPDVDEEMARILSRALEPEPANRYSTAQEFAVDLEAHLDKLGGHFSPKALGTLVSKAFTEERERIRAVIDEQLRHAQSVDSQSAFAIPKLALPQASELTPSGESQNRSGSRRTPADVAREFRTVGRQGDLARRRKTLFGIVGGVSFLLVIGLVSFNAGRGQTSVAPASSSAMSTASASASSGASGASTASSSDGIRLRVTASPPTARIFVDDAELDSNPYDGSLPKGGSHRIRAEAPGFVTATETRAFDADVTLSMALERAKADAGQRAPSGPVYRPRAPATPAAPATAASQPPAAPPAPAPAQSNAHTIDPSDPYAK